MSVPNPEPQLSLLGVRPIDRRIPLDFSLADIRKLRDESHALEFSVRCSGYDTKEVPLLFGIDGGQWSCILKDEQDPAKKHFPHRRRNEFMDFVGNEILLMYSCESRGYDFATLRRHQTETEQELSRERARNAALEQEISTLRSVIVGSLGVRK